MEEKIAKCSGDSQQYDGGWFAEYDGKWLDITNEVQNVKQLFLDTIEKAKPDVASNANDRGAGWNMAVKEYQRKLKKEINHE